MSKNKDLKSEDKDKGLRLQDKDKDKDLGLRTWARIMSSVGQGLSSRTVNNVTMKNGLLTL